MCQGRLNIPRMNCIFHIALFVFIFHKLKIIEFRGSALSTLVFQNANTDGPYGRISFKDAWYNFQIEMSNYAQKIITPVISISIHSFNVSD